jgi:hypothetical protein
MFERDDVVSAAIVSGLTVGNFISWKIGLRVFFYILWYFVSLSLPPAPPETIFFSILTYTMGVSSGILIIPLSSLIVDLVVCMHEIGGLALCECFYSATVGQR